MIVVGHNVKFFYGIPKITKISKRTVVFSEDLPSGTRIEISETKRIFRKGYDTVKRIIQPDGTAFVKYPNDKNIHIEHEGYPEYILVRHNIWRLA